MKKSDQDRYLLSAQEEHALLFATAQDALKRLATIHVGLEPLPQEDLKDLLNSKKLVDGIVSFTTKEELQKQWKGVNWKDNPTVLAHLLASCGKKEIIIEAPLDWKNLVSDIPKGRMYQQTKEIEPHWLVETMVKGRNVFFDHLAVNYKSSLALSRSQKAFWDALLENKQVTHDTPFDCMAYKNPKTLTLFQMSVVYNNPKLYKRFPLSKTITNKDNAETTMLCAMQRNIYFSHDADEKYITRLLNRCLKFKPDLNKVFEKRSPVEQLTQLVEKKESQEKKPKKDKRDVVESGMEYLYFNNDVKQWEKEKNVSLREELFIHLTGVNATQNASLVQYLLDDLKSLSEKDQQKFVQGINDACNAFPFNNTNFISQVITSVYPSVQRKLFVDHMSFLSHEDVGTEMLKTFIQSGVKFDREILQMCANMHLSLEEGKSDESQYEWGVETGLLFPKLFDKQNQDHAKRLGLIVSSERYGEKADLAKALWQKDFDNNTQRPSQASRLM